MLDKQSKSQRANLINILNRLTVSETREVKGTSAFSFCPIPLSPPLTTAKAKKEKKVLRNNYPRETHYINNIFSHATCFDVAFEKVDNSFS